MRQDYLKNYQYFFDWLIFQLIFDVHWSRTTWSHMICDKPNSLQEYQFYLELNLINQSNFAVVSMVRFNYQSNFLKRAVQKNKTGFKIFFKYLFEPSSLNHWTKIGSLRDGLKWQFIIKWDYMNYSKNFLTRTKITDFVILVFRFWVGIHFRKFDSIFLFFTLYIYLIFLAVLSWQVSLWFFYYLRFFLLFSRIIFIVQNHKFSGYIRYVSCHVHLS